MKKIKDYEITEEDGYYTELRDYVLWHLRGYECKNKLEFTKEDLEEIQKNISDIHKKITVVKDVTDWPF